MSSTQVMSERVTFLATPQFKETLKAEADKAGVSVGDLVRSRFERSAAEEAEEAEVRKLTAELIVANEEARGALASGLAAANAVIAELRSLRAAREGKAKVIAEAEPPSGPSKDQSVKQRRRASA